MAELSNEGHVQDSARLPKGLQGWLAQDNSEWHRLTWSTTGQGHKAWVFFLTVNL